MERPTAATMPCKRKAQTSTTKVVAKQETTSQNTTPKIYGCTVESHDSTRRRVESSLPAKHKDHIAGTGFISITICNLVHKFIPQPQAMKILDAKAAVDKEWKKLETIPAWKLEKVKSKKEVILEAQSDRTKVHFATSMDIYHFKNAELEPTLQKYNGTVDLRGDIVIDDSGAYAVFIEQGSSASQMTAAKVMDVNARFPDCDGQASDAVSAYTQAKLEDAPRLLKIPTTECLDVWKCKQLHLTRHFFPVYARMCNNLSHDIGSSVCARHLIHVSCACVFGLSSTLSSHSSFVSSIFYFILLIIDFIFHVDVAGARSPVHFAE